METPEAPAPRKRRWRSVSVRAMLGLVLAVGLPMGWWAREAQLQRAAVARVEAAHGSVVYRHEVLDPDGTVSLEAEKRTMTATLKASGNILPPGATFKGSAQARAAAGSAPAPNPAVEWIGRQLGADYVQTVVRVIAVDSDRIADSDLSRLAGLPRLEHLNLGHTGIGDAGLIHLAGLGHLKTLSLYRTRITDAGLAHLAGLEQLEDLAIAHNGGAITDDGLAHLKGLRRLRTLEVGGPGITDAGLEHLRELPDLKSLLLIDTPNVTPGGLDRLRQGHPGLKITRG